MQHLKIKKSICTVIIVIVLFYILIHLNKQNIQNYSRENVFCPTLLFFCYIYFFIRREGIDSKLLYFDIVHTCTVVNFALKHNMKYLHINL